MGQMIPRAPASSSFMMIPGSSHGTRTMGVASLADATMRKGIESAAKEIAAEIALQINERIKPKP